MGPAFTTGLKLYAHQRDSTGNGIALAHHWLVGMRGGEKVLEHFDRLFPQAPIYTLIAKRENLTPELRQHRIHESALSVLPGAARHYKKMLPLFPAAFRGLRVNGATRFLLSSDASVAKGLQYDPAIPTATRPRAIYGECKILTCNTCQGWDRQVARFSGPSCLMSGNSIIKARNA